MSDESDVKLQYNLGVAAYKSGDFAKAGAALDQSLHSDRLDMRVNRTSRILRTPDSRSRA